MMSISNDGGKLTLAQAERFLDFIKRLPPVTHRVWRRSSPDEDGRAWTWIMEVEGEPEARRMASWLRRTKRGTVWWNKIGGKR